MKCPFQTIVTHIPAHMEMDGIIKVDAKDVTTFGECLEKDCPFYGKRWVKAVGEAQLQSRPECRRNM